MASSTKYLRRRTVVELSRSTDYSSPIYKEEHTETLTPTRHKILEILAVTGGLTIDLAEFGTITDIEIVNRDGTNFVDTTHRNTPGGATDQNTRINAGQSVKLGPVTPGNDLVLTADTADCECIVEIYGTV